MAADVLGQRVDHDIGAVIEGAAQHWRGDGVVDDQRHAMLVGDLGQTLEIDDVAGRIADGLAEDGAGLVIDQRLEAGEIIEGRHAHLDPLTRQAMGEQVVGAAIQLAGADDVVADLHQRLDGIGDRRHAGSHRQRRDTALDGGHALLQHVIGRVHDAGVDVARHLEIEEVRAVLGIIEGVGGGLVDRHRRRLGGGFRGIAVM